VGEIMRLLAAIIISINVFLSGILIFKIDQAYKRFDSYQQMVLDVSSIVGKEISSMRSKIKHLESYVDKLKKKVDSIKIPEIPKVKVPEVKIPSIKVPDKNNPKVPKLPKFKFERRYGV
jgi:hypothetical protein